MKEAGALEDRLRAVVVLEPEAGGGDLAPLQLDDALRSILPHSYCFFAQERRARQTTLAYLDLVARVPCFRFAPVRGFAWFEAALDILEQGLSDGLQAC
jgi:hypothetical protein